MCTSYQNKVADKVFNKRFNELDCQKRAMVNTYIENIGFYFIIKHPDLIKHNWDVVLQSAKVSGEGKSD